MSTYSSGVPVWDLLQVFLDSPERSFGPVDVAHEIGVPVRRTYPVLAGLCDLEIVRVVRDAPPNDARRRLYQLCVGGGIRAQQVLVPEEESTEAGRFRPAPDEAEKSR